MRKPPDYEGIESRLWRDNAKQVVKRLDNDDEFLLKRISTFVSRFGFPTDSVKDKIRSDNMFSAHFAKEPRRQSLHEKIAAEWLNAVDGIDGFKTLPKSGRNAWYITSDGNLQQGMKPAPSKSLDFRWTSGGYTVFASHKYTKEGGGNQDSQFKEMRLLLEHYQKGAEKDNIILLVVVDGPYYNTNRMRDLKRFERSVSPISKALPIEQVPVFLEEVTKDEQGEK